MQLVCLELCVLSGDLCSSFPQLYVLVSMCIRPPVHVCVFACVCVYPQGTGSWSFVNPVWQQVWGSSFSSYRDLWVPEAVGEHNRRYPSLMMALLWTLQSAETMHTTCGTLKVRFYSHCFVVTNLWWHPHFGISAVKACAVGKRNKAMGFHSEVCIPFIWFESISSKLSSSFPSLRSSDNVLT